MLKLYAKILLSFCLLAGPASAWAAIAPTTYGSIPGQAGTSWAPGLQMLLRLQTDLDGNAALLKKGDISSAFRIGARYRLSSENNLGLFQEVVAQNQFDSRPAGSLLKDLFVDFAHSRSIGDSDWWATIHFREYFPTGKISRQIGQQGREQAWVDIARDYGNFAFSSQLNISYRRNPNQARQSAAGKLQGLVRSDQAVYSGATYHLTKKADVWQRFGLEGYQKFATSTGSYRTFLSFASETGIAYLCDKNLIASVSYSDTAAINQGDHLRLFQALDSAVHFSLDWKL